MKNQRIIYGTMGLSCGNQRKADTVFDHIFSRGIDFIDTADIYQQGDSEKAIGDYLRRNPELRKDITIQSKLGIQNGGTSFGARYNFSYEHITAGIQGILERLSVDCIDILLFHRPDPLVERDEVFKAVDMLFSQGLVKSIGVSNMHRAHIELMEAYTGRHIMANQLEMSLRAHEFASSTPGFNNSLSSVSTQFPIGTVEYCMLHDVSLQSWSPLARGLYSSDTAPESGRDARVWDVVGRLAGEYETSREAIVLAWIMRHPARIAPVIGTTNTGRIDRCLQANDVELSRDHWYELLSAACGSQMP
jgi:predicted oxidoreductase